MALFRYTDECLEAVSQWSGISAKPGKWSRLRPAGITVFTSRFVEHVFGRAHPITPIVWFGPLIGYGLYRGLRDSGVLAIIIFLVGWLMWTLAEYLLHRYLFHHVGETPEGKFRAFMMHGYHHEFPDDRWRLVAPPLMSWPLGVVIIGSYYLLVGAHWAPVAAGTAFGYVAYDWTHYYTHHFQPRHRLGKWLRRHHLSHHYKDGETNFGISTPLWDFVFGTYRPTKRSSYPAENPASDSLS